MKKLNIYVKYASGESMRETLEYNPAENGDICWLFYRVNRYLEDFNIKEVSVCIQLDVEDEWGFGYKTINGLDFYKDTIRLKNDIVGVYNYTAKTFLIVSKMQNYFYETLASKKEDDFFINERERKHLKKYIDKLNNHNLWALYEYLETNLK